MDIEASRAFTKQVKWCPHVGTRLAHTSFPITTKTSPLKVSPEGKVLGGYCEGFENQGFYLPKESKRIKTIDTP